MVMRDLNLAIDIRADAGQAENSIRKLRRAVRDAGAAVGRAGKQSRQAGEGFDRLGQSSVRAARGMRRMDIAIGNLAGHLLHDAIARTLGEIARLPGVLADAGLEIEALTQRFRFAAGSIDAGVRELQFVRQEAERLGISFSAAAGGYSSLLAAARGTNISIGQTREIFLGIAEASAVLRLSQDEVAGALRAVQQVMSKGTLQAEEIRGQLGERLPGAFQIAARAMGVTTSELNRMLERGEVLSDEFLPRFGARLRQEFSDSVPDAADSSAASLARMANAFERLSQAVAGSGVLEFFARLAEQAADAADAVSGTGSQIDALTRSIGQLRRDRAIQSPDDLLLGTPLQDTSGAERRMRDRLASLRLEDVPPDFAAPIEESARRATGAVEDLSQEYDGFLKSVERSINAELHDTAPTLLSVRREEQALAEVDGLLARGVISRREAEEQKSRIVRIESARRAGIEARAEQRAFDAVQKIRREQERDRQRRERARQAEDRERLLALGNLDRLEISLADPYDASIASIIAWRDATVQSMQDAGIAVSVYGEIVEAVFQDRLDNAISENAERILRESRHWQSGAQRALKDYAESAANAAENIEQAMANSFRGAEDALVRFAETGKLEFGSLVDSILADLARLLIRQSITGPLAAGLAGFFGGLGGGTPAHYLDSPSFHSGGLVGSGAQTLRQVPAGAFAFAPRYHGGGIAGLRPDEVPAILQRGETVIPRDGGVAMPPVVINFTNTGTPQRERNSERRIRFDPRGVIVDVVLEDLTQGGPIRTEVRRQTAGI